MLKFDIIRLHTEKVGWIYQSLGGFDVFKSTPGTRKNSSEEFGYDIKGNNLVGLVALNRYEENEKDTCNFFWRLSKEKNILSQGACRNDVGYCRSLGLLGSLSHKLGIPPVIYFNL